MHRYDLEHPMTSSDRSTKGLDAAGLVLGIVMALGPLTAYAVGFGL